MPPREWERRLADNETAVTTAADDNTIPPGKRLCWVPCTRTYAQDKGSQLRRRREAASRMVRLRDCCGARDPLSCLSCRCHDPIPKLSENAIEAWRDAIKRTLPIGPPIVPLEVLQRLWRNDGADRELAERVWELTGGLVA
jgi:hypothetical protein